LTGARRRTGPGALPAGIPGVILAGGAGSRLGKLGRRYSKPMVPVAGRPLIAWVIERLRTGGVGRLIVVRHAGDTPLAAYVRAAVPDAQLAVQHERFGIADALCRALPLLGGAPAYLACACDSLFRPDDVAALVAAVADGNAAVGVIDMGRAATSSRSAVRLQGDCVVEIIEKPAPGSAPSGVVAVPLYALPRTVDDFLRAAAARGGERYISAALSAYVQAGGLVRAVRLRERLEVTTAADAAALARRLRRRVGMSR
jgi:UDP-N-acetylglucosamine diphosphorylase / glucose-1-phosphate thymidylyltransferase / UDP-N-acetylgalactosamine diphosphorylase / glucosamine-1-phosphate N-acetyltransferase / galactosamine-1-phosphate N-acetyltransferase